MASKILAVSAVAGAVLWSTVPRASSLGPEATRAALLAGLRPTALAAAGCGASQVAAVYDDLRAATASLLALKGAEAQMRQANLALAAADALLGVDPTNPAARSARAGARQDRAAAAQAWRGATAAVKEACAAPLPGPVRERLDLVAAAERWRVPAEFGVVARTGAQWRALESALVAEQRAQRAGEVVPAPAAALLASARADARVVAARQNLASTLSAAQAAFQALGGPG